MIGQNVNPETRGGAAQASPTAVAQPRTLPIRWRLALLFGAISSVVLAIMLTAAYAFYARGLYQGIDSFLIGASKQAVANVRAGTEPAKAVPASAGVFVTLRRYNQNGQLTWGSSGETQPWLKLPQLEPLAVMAQPAGPAYDTIAGWLPSLQATPQAPQDSAFAILMTPGARWRSLLTNLGAQGFLEVTTSLARFDDTAGRLRSFLISLGLAGAAIGFAASLAISGRALQPVTRLIGAAKQIADSGSLNARIAMPASSDELGLLAGTLNTMLDSLEVHYRQLELISRAAPVGLALVNDRLEYVEVSETLARWNGLSRAAHLGRRPSELFGEQGVWAQEQLRNAFETGQSQVGLERTVGSAENERFFVTSFYPVNEGGFVGAGCVVQDISDRKRAEKTLFESEARFQAALESSRTGIWEYDLARDELKIDGAYGSFYGLRNGPHRMQASEISRFTPLGERERNRPEFEHAMQAGDPFEIEYRVLVPDQPERWLLARGRPMPADLTHLRTKVSGTVVDITERKRAEAVLETQTQVLRDSLEQQNRFVSDASHELRAPLTAILGNLGVLERYPDLPNAERLEAITEATREAKRLGRLVSDLLTLARGDAGVQQAFEEIDLADVVLEAWQDASQLSDGHSLEQGIMQTVRVEGNRDRLKQLALILLDNAIKYTPVGGSVKLELRRIDGLNGPLAEVVVTDSGHGISSEDLPHVFERFYRADRSRSPGSDPGGTGLGLPIAHSIAIGHGGEISLESQLGNGTRAIVHLPAIERN